MNQTLKTCTSCKESKPLDSFSKDKYKKDGFNNHCKPCKEQRRADSLSKHSHKPCSECGKGKRLKTHTLCSECNSIRIAMSAYNITKEEATDLRAQDHCDACGRSKEEAATERSFHIDHCHEGGHVRGVLCSYCNTALGMMLDDPIRIRKLEMYLNRVNYDEDNTGNHG